MIFNVRDLGVYMKSFSCSFFVPMLTALTTMQYQSTLLLS